VASACIGGLLGGLGLVAGGGVNRCEVLVDVGAAVGSGDNVVGLVGAGLAADVADTAVASDDALGSGLFG